MLLCELKYLWYTGAGGPAVGLQFEDGLGEMRAWFYTVSGLYLTPGSIARTTVPWVPSGNEIVVGGGDGAAYYYAAWPAINGWETFQPRGELGELRIRPYAIVNGYTIRGELWAWMNIYRNGGYVGDGWCYHPDTVGV